METRDFANRTLGHYRLIKRLGSGGMGDVFLAEDDRLGRKAAVKVIGSSHEGSATARKRLLREARAAAAIDHPGVCTVYDVAEAGGEAYIAMQYVEGESLAERLRRSPMSLDEVHVVARQVCEALEAAHARGILHRDIKPQNIMLTPSGRVIVLDFGLASFSESDDVSRLTQTGQVVGTPSYMSPEQISADELDERSDIFSFGVVLFELLTSRCPFSRPSVTATIAAVLFDEPALEGVPRDWRPILARSLSKDRQKRYGDMKQVLADLTDLNKVSSGMRVDLDSTEKTAVIERPLAKKAEELSNSPSISVAVMPLSADSATEEAEYVAESLTDTAIDTLSRITGLKVMARSTVFRYTGEPDPGIFGRTLHVSSVLTGYLQRRAGRIIANLELVDVSTGERLWSARLEEPENEIVKLHEQLRNAIPRHFRSPESLPAVSQTSQDPEALRHYLVGRHQWNRRTGPSTKIAIQSFQKAIDLDPLMAPAYVGLADALSYMGFLEVMLPGDVFPRARAAAKMALSLDPDSGEALTSLGFVSGDHDFDFSRASSYYRRALAANPNYGVAHHWFGVRLVFRGEIDQGEMEIKKAQQLDPLNPILNVALGFPHYFRRRFDEAIAIYRGLLELEPNFMPLRNYLGVALSVSGRPEEAVEHCRIAIDLGGGSTIAAASLGFALAKLGEENEARGILASLDTARASRYSSAFAPAVIHAGLGDVERSIDWLDTALEERSPWLLTTRFDPRFDALKDHPRFEQFVNRVGFWDS